MELMYTVGTDDLSRIRTWVDASYVVHPDMRSHTGGVISIGRGGIMCKSTKQKLNTKSSTEAEVVGASDYLPNTIWFKYFLEAQGYKVEESLFEQDNESAIRLEKNGRASAGQKSRHINIRYFFIKDRVQAEDITIRHCPTLEMLADFFTKPLQGNLFRKFRDLILGYVHIDTLTQTPQVSVEERVGDQAKTGEVRMSTVDMITKDDEVQTRNSIDHEICGEEKPWVLVTSKKKGSFQRVSKRNESSLVGNNPVV